jgi:hypothetical protein
MLMIDTAACAIHAPCNLLEFLVAKLPSVRRTTPTPYTLNPKP